MAPPEHPEQPRRGPWTRRAAIGGGVVLALALIVAAVHLLDSPPAAKKPTAQQIQLVRPATPPPPPKPPEKPPEPPKVKEEVKVDTPKPEEQPKPAEAPPPAERLGVDAAGSGQGDGFGLAANPGGRDITQSAPTVGGGGGGSGGAIARAQFAGYRDVVTRHINEHLTRVSELRTTEGQVAVLVWLDRSGRIERVDLRDATPRQTELITKSLMASPPLRELPPSALPQPVWVLVNLRDLG
jgi:protein TonB